MKLNLDMYISKYFIHKFVSISFGHPVYHYGVSTVCRMFIHRQNQDPFLDSILLLFYDLHPLQSFWN